MIDVDWSFSTNPIVFFTIAGSLIAVVNSDKQNTGVLKNRIVSNYFKPVILIIGFVISTIGIFIYLGDKNFQDAQFFISEGDVENAEYSYQKSISINPVSPIYHRALAQLYLYKAETSDSKKLDYYEKAKEELLHSDKHNSRDHITHRLLGEIYYKKGSIDDAMNELKKSIELFPKENLESYLGLAEIYKNQNKNLEIIVVISELKKNYSPELFKSQTWLTLNREKIKQDFLSLLVLLEEAYEKNGRAEEAKKIIDEVAVYSSK